MIRITVSTACKTNPDPIEIEGTTSAVVVEQIIHRTTTYEWAEATEADRNDLVNEVLAASTADDARVLDLIVTDNE